MSAPAIGDWVQASESPEFDLARRGAVGTFIRIHHSKQAGRLYAVGPREDSTIYGYYSHIRRVTKADGRQVLKAWRELRDEYWHRHSKKIGDEIREFLWGTNWRGKQKVLTDSQNLESMERITGDSPEAPRVHDT